jgi:hypothetical protein
MFLYVAFYLSNGHSGGIRVDSRKLLTRTRLATTPALRVLAQTRSRVWRVHAKLFGECRRVWRVSRVRESRVLAKVHMIRCVVLCTKNIFYMYKTV